MDDNLDDFDEYGNYVGPDGQRKQHTSILGKIIVLIVAFFLITVIIDPMTTNVNESEIIYDIGSYPYEKVMGLFRENPQDSDNDGLPDNEETRGWELESEVISLSKGDISTYEFDLDHNTDYLIYLNVLTGGTTNIKWGLDVPKSPVSVNAEDWRVITLNSNATNLNTGSHIVWVEVLDGNITIDWISLVAPDYEYAVSLDAGNTIVTNGTVMNMMVHVSTDPNNPDTDFDGMLDGYEVATGVRIGGWQDPLVTNNRFAFLLAGGSTNPNENYPSIKNNVEFVYEVLHDFYGYSDENIRVLSWDGEVQNKDIIDSAGTLVDIDTTFNELEQEMGPNDFLFVYIVSHGLVGQVEVFKSHVEHDVYEYSNLRDNLTSLKNSVGLERMALVVEACHSGSCINDVNGDDIVVIGSTEPEDDSYTFSESYALFSYYFFEALEHPNLASLPSYEKVKNIELTFEEHKFISLGEAFTIARDKLRVQGITKNEQVPLIDGDGDGIPDSEGSEAGLAYVTYI